MLSTSGPSRPEPSRDATGDVIATVTVEESAVKEPSLYIAHISVEMAPIAKVWGRGCEGCGIGCGGSRPLLVVACL